MHSAWLVLLFLASAGICAENTEEWRTVRIAQGPIRGRFEPENGVYSFYNIPYATAPTGTERFKAPRPPPVWVTTFDAVDERIVCPQAGSSLNARENCLIANVHVPNTQERNLPVVVLIHGGAFQFSYGNSGTVNALVRTDKIIAVTFNYRLSVHGFLCLGTEDAPGNAGLKDQLALLRWVQQNIASFGGNPEDVTLFGCSAGAGSTDVMTLSKVTDGLFNKAILGSGVSSGAVGIQVDPLSNAKTYAKLLNFSNVDDINALGEFYKTASFEQLYQAIGAISGNQNAAVLFSPCIEKDLGQERILDDAPVNIITKGIYRKVPLLYGYANMEGLMRIPFFHSWKDEMNEKFTDFLPVDLQFQSEQEKEEVAKTVKEFYFGNQTVSEETILRFIDFFTDQTFAYPILRTLALRLQSLNDTIYLYEYSFTDENTPIIPHTLDARGADHCDQFMAVRDEDKTNITEEYRRIKAIMREFFLNFILTGTPVPEGSDLPSWPAANRARSPHMSVDRTVTLKGPLSQDRAELWDSIYEKYYRVPIPPSVNEDSTPGGTAIFKASKALMLFSLIVYFSKFIL